MTYEEFKIAMTAEVTNLAGEEVNVLLHRIPKNNGIILDAITVMGNGQNAAPSIYLKDFYLRYRQGSSVRELAEEILEFSRLNHIRGRIPEKFFLDFSLVRKRICFKLIHYKKNAGLLRSVPHRRVLDLAMVFYYSMEPNVLEHASVLIRNTDVERWHTTGKEIEDLAMENTPRLMEWRFSTLSELLQEFMDGDKREDEIDPFRIDPDEVQSAPMYVLTNREKYFGAACMLYPDLLKQISDKLNDNLYILPSSIHECIIMPASGEYSQKSLSEMVTEINEVQVDETEVLSDNVYYFDRMTGSIAI
ncbi:MAG: DUF5688 family protein [Lachnospiraceae bacterium]|nr:DUF5688 family protein [Lachnospiraceae bacterium]